MKTFLLVLAAASLSGCAVYPVPAYETYGAPPYVVGPPVYLYGGAMYSYPYGGYGYGYDYPYAYPRGYSRPPGAFARHAPRPGMHVPRTGHGSRNRDNNRDRNVERKRADRQPNDRPRR